MNDAQAQILFKLLLIAFGGSIGVCCLFWPHQVNRKFRRWRGLAAEPTEADLTAPGTQHQSPIAQAIRQFGALLVALTLFGIYNWIRQS